MSVLFNKFDKNKTKFSLLHPVALESIAEVFTYGAIKYSDWNWFNSPTWSKYYDALQRHLNAYWDGEDNDQESNLLHLAHAGCCVIILLVFQLLKISKDDRPRYNRR